MRRWLIWFGIWLSVSPLLQADDLMIRWISERKWDELPSHFADHTYLELEKNFGNFDSIHVSLSGKNELLYKVKYKNYAEVGNIIYNQENSRYSKLAIINQIITMIEIKEMIIPQKVVTGLCCVIILITNPARRPTERR